MKHEKQIVSEESAIHSPVHYKTVEEPRIPLWIILVFLAVVVGTIYAFGILHTYPPHSSVGARSLLRP